jgi:ribosomal protein L11 methyltransferase
MKLVKRMKNPSIPTLWRWTRMTSEKWEDAWIERLQFLGPGRAAVIGWPGSRSVRIEAFCDERMGRKLVREFGGKLTKARDWIAQPDQPRKPLRIRGKLTVYGDPESFAARREEGTPFPSRGGGAAMLIPAGMAFGTGEHATTASCLRMLCDVRAELPPEWRAIDAGTGSGILAIAAAALGATDVEAFDFDPACVRIAKANARANRARTVRVAQADVLQWMPQGTAEVVMANLFSDLLMQAAPVLKRATKRGGRLIFSGVVGAQLTEVLETFERLKFSIERTVIRGKWTAGLCRRA